MIGFFDSGLGGLTILKEAEKLLPGYDYIYFGDNARTPYGSRSNEVIYEFTIECLREIFRRGARIVILACNTSSGVALRRIQQEFLPNNFPDRKVLGIVIPTAEEINSITKNGRVGIFGTEATINSKSYEMEIKKIDETVEVFGVACPLLVPLIEAGEKNWEGIDLAIEKYINELMAKDKNIDSLILGCTHYALIHDQIRKHLPENIKLVSQGELIAKKLHDYFLRHPEIDELLPKNGKKIFLSTDGSDKINYLANLFYGDKINVEKVNLPDIAL